MASVTYESDDTAAVASCGCRTSGEVSIVAMTGITTITATKAADANYNEAIATYTLTVVNAPVPLTLLARAMPFADQTYNVGSRRSPSSLPLATGGTGPI